MPGSSSGEDSRSASAPPRAAPRPARRDGDASVRFLILDLFTGMAGLCHALALLGVADDAESLGIRVHMFETDPDARKLLRAMETRWRLLSDAEDSAGLVGSVLALVENAFALLQNIISRYPNLIHVLVAGGSPCQGFSFANPKAKGVKDPRSALIWVFHAIAWRLPGLLPPGATLALFLENVRMHAVTRDSVSKLFGIEAREVDAELFGMCSRPRNFWNAYAVSDDPPPRTGSPGDVLEPGWRPLWELMPRGTPPASFRTFTRPFGPGAPPEYPVSFWKFSLATYDERGLVYRPDSEELPRIRDFVTRCMRCRTGPLRHGDPALVQLRGEVASWIHEHGGASHLRPLSPDERDRCLGFPAGASIVDSPPSGNPVDVVRASLAGNAWAPPAAAFLLRPFADAARAGIAPPTALNLPPFTKPEDTLSRIAPAPGGLRRRG